MAQKATAITDDVMRSMAMGKVHKDNVGRINSLSFFSDGQHLVSGSDDESIHLYNATSGESEKVVYSKKYGVDLARFTHHNNSILCASKNGWDDSLRYLSLYDNRYLRYFRGHRDKVVSLALSPSSDSFLSSSLDQTVRLWDLRTSACQGLLRRKGGAPQVQFDPQGLIFAVASHDTPSSPNGMPINTIKLYDMRSYDKGAFSTFQPSLWHLIPSKSSSSSSSNTLLWNSMKFSPDGKHILLATNQNLILLLDSFSGQMVQHYTSFSNETGLPLEPSFTPDAKYVLCGGEDGRIHVWETLTGREIAVWSGHPGPIQTVLWNPAFMMAASACSNLVMWITTEPEDNDSDMR